MQDAEVAPDGEIDEPSPYGGDNDNIQDQVPENEVIKLSKRKSSKRNVFLNFCCIAREYFSDVNGLVNSLQIIPRVIVYKRSLRMKSKYGLTLTLKNNSPYPRYFYYHTDSPIDTTISFADPELHRYIQSDETLELLITIQPTTKRDINRVRHIYIESVHPNIVFEVPIIVLQNLKEPVIANNFVFPSCTPNSKTYYDMAVYNPTKEPVKFKISSSIPGVDIDIFNNELIPKMDYLRVFLSFSYKPLKVFKGAVSVKFGIHQPRLIIFTLTPRLVSVYVNVGRIDFSTLKFERELKRTITICNEGPNDVKVSVEFYKPQESSSSSSKDAIVTDSFHSQSMHSMYMYDFDEESLPKGTKPSLSEPVNIFSIALKKASETPTAYQHFNIDVPDYLKGYSSVTGTLTFHPVYDIENPFDDNLEPPYPLSTMATFSFSDGNDCVQNNFMMISGLISGPEIELAPKAIDFRKIYLGEEHCSFIKIVNIDGLLEASVRFKEYRDPSVANVVVTPSTSFVLAPCALETLHLSFFSIMPGKFNVVLVFKVVNGPHYKLPVKGQGVNVNLRTFPQLVEFGSVPICVPQKRYLLLINPLSVPITLQVWPTEDGEEQPLVLNIEDYTGMMPIDVKDPVMQLQMVNSDWLNEGYENVEIAIVDDKEKSGSFHSYESTDSIYSTQFEEEIIGNVPSAALHLLTALKKQKIFDKSETDKRVIQEALSYLLNNKYFSAFVKHSNYLFMDWNGIPSDPKEVYCDNEVIYLRPNTGKSVTVLIIPNNVGYFHRSLTVRICPANLPCIDGSEEEKTTTLIKSEFLCSKVWFEYNCCIPDIDWTNDVDLSNRVIYAGENYDFDMLFLNSSSVGGFFHFDVVPTEMTFRDGQWKFYISADDEITAKCTVNFKTLGPIMLSGLVKIVGAPRPYPYYILANALPTEINITPKYIRKRFHVLEIDKVHFYIDNASPTNTLLLMHLKDIDYQYLTSRGSILAPTGQSTYTTLVSYFYDPDLYTNTLVIDLQFGHILELPITYIVEGVPIFFEPNIQEGFDAGTIFTDSKENFYANISHYNQIVKVTNRGRRAYRLNITRLKTYTVPLNGTKRSLCTVVTLNARFDMSPKSLYLPPDSYDYLNITASAFEECFCYTEFRIEIIDQKYPQRTHALLIKMQAKFINCNLTWARKKFCFNFKRTHVFNERPYIDTCALINPHDQDAYDVHLEVTGPFRIKELFEHQFQKLIQINIDPYERKDIFIIVNKAPLKELYCKTIDGRINVFAYGRAQRSLPLKVNVLVPNVVILHSELVYFARGAEYARYVDIMNVGCMSAEFKWKRIDVTQQFIGEFDNSRDFIADLLSEIVRMVDYELTDDSEPNMTLRYRKYKCRHEFVTEARNDIMDIIDEIINNLDLSHKRYVVYFSEENKKKDDGNDEADQCVGEEEQEEEEQVESEPDSQEQSSRSCVRQTISEILAGIKIESSFAPSPATSEHCFAERSIYFYEKTGLLQTGSTLPCALHIPYIRRAYEVKAYFELNIIGGESRTLTVTVVNIVKKIRFSNDSIYLSIRPWYELCENKLRVYNVTNYNLRLTINAVKDPLRKDKPLSGGTAKLTSNKMLELPPHGSGLITLECLLGFSESFNRCFAVDINESAEESFCLRGQGVMPILSMTSTLNEIEQNPFEIAEEYRLLQEIYYYEMFQAITFVDEEPTAVPGEEEAFHLSVGEDDHTISDFETISETTEDMDSEKLREHDIKFFKVVHSYVLVNNNEELPNAIVLKQLLEAAKYRNCLRVSPERYKIHQQVYNSYVKLKKSNDELMPLNLKHFMVQPIPCELHGNVLDLGTLYMNTIKRFSFTLHFFGPGKLIAAARTAVKIPGLFVDFHAKDHVDKKFVYWSEKCKAPEFFNKKYRNMFERLMDADTDPKVKHAHSFDIDDLVKHQRDLSENNRRIIEDYYNSLNLSVYEDHKHHFVLCKIHTRHHSNFSGVDLDVVGLYKPESKYYEAGQLIEDFIYIDLHMGPTLPILLRGVLKS